jgi:hypothetical protein
MRSLLKNQASNWVVTEDTRACRSFASLPTNNIFVLSAYKTTLACLIFKGKSFIYTKNKRGPNIDPWGTPHLVVLIFEWILSWVKLFLLV